MAFAFRRGLRLFVFIAVVAVLSGAGTPSASAAPVVTELPDWTTHVQWDLDDPSDYSFANASLASGAAVLPWTSGAVNRTSAADFASPNASSNVDLLRWPGAVALGNTSGPVTHFTLQPGAAGNDAGLDEAAPTANSGAATSLLLSGRSGNQLRILLRFDLTALPAGVIVDGALLRLFESGGNGGPTVVNAHLAAGDWDESQASWTDRVTGTPWGAPGGDYDPAVIDGTTLDNAAAWRSWNVTRAVDLWARGLRTDFGLLIAAVPGGNADKTIASSDASNPSLRPTLDVWYRSIGASGSYDSEVAGPGVPARWDGITWAANAPSLASESFDGPSLGPRWAWTSPPPAWDVSTTTPGALHLLTATAVDFGGATFTGHLLAEPIAGNFTATAQITVTPTIAGQKAGLMVLAGSRDWYAARVVFFGGTVRYQVAATENGVTTVRTDVAGTAGTVWLRIARAGDAFTAAASADGQTWTAADAFAPAMQYPLASRLGPFAADGASGIPLAVDVDFITLSSDDVASVAVQTRTGNTPTVDGSWTPWSLDHPNPGGSAMNATGAYAQVRLAFAVRWPDHAPAVDSVVASWSRRVPSGTVETRDLVRPDVGRWIAFDATDVGNGQTVTYSYSLDGGAGWTPLSPAANLTTLSTASGRIRFRATLATSDIAATPEVLGMGLTFQSALDHFRITAPPTVVPGTPFSLTITAEDSNGATVVGWTGAVALEAVRADGVTSAGGVLGVATATLASGGSATLDNVTYGRPETIRVRASAIGRQGVSASVVIAVPPAPFPWLLAAMPGGFLSLVIPMLVQRARWRPAKAFLVDEKDERIREFTIDPGCEVTWDEVRGAGALDARDASVRVSRYHARTVRGDALGLVLLAVGPVTESQIEFAREMLVSIQDKFEDRVKARLAELRAEEARIAKARDELAVAETGVGAARDRARKEIDDLRKQMVARATIVAPPREDPAVAAREAQIKEAEAALAQREEEVSARETQVDGFFEELAAKVAKTARWEKNLKERQAHIEDRAKELKAREERARAKSG